MNTVRLVGLSSVAIIMTVAGCATVRPAPGSKAPPAPTTKLELASAAGAPLTGAGAPALLPIRPVRYVLDTPLADLGDRAVVWRMNPPALTVQDVQRFAGVLGLAGTPARTAAGWDVRGARATLALLVDDAAVWVSYVFGVPSAEGGSAGAGGSAAAVGSASGGGAAGPVGGVASPATEPKATEPKAADPAKPVPAVPPVVAPIGVPTSGQALSIARGLLDHLGVLAGPSWSASVSDSGVVAFGCPAGASCPEVAPQVIARTVRFSPTLDGTRVDGVDWSVTLGERSRVESVDGEWASPVPVGSYPLLTSIAAFTGLQHGTARYPGPQPMADGAAMPDAAPETAAMPDAAPETGASVIHVTGVSLGLARWDGYLHNHPAVDLVPTYRFHVKTGTGPAYDIQLLALDPSVIAFTNPAPIGKPVPAQPAPSAVPAQPAPSAVPGPNSAPRG